MESRLIGIDTESHAGIPWSVQASIRVGTGVLVLIDDTKAMRELTHQINAKVDDGWELVFHNAIADLPIMDLIGVNYEGHYRDSMVECYNLGNQPQALKELGYRLFGVRMKSWEDTVLPHSKDVLVEWMISQLVSENEHPVIERVQLKTKVKEIRKQNPNAKLLQRVIQHTLKGTDYDPWERLEGKFSNIPQKGIAHVPLEEAVQYACRDADITLRLAIELDHLREEAKREYPTSQDDWDRSETLSHS